MQPLIADELRGTVYSGFDALSFIDCLYPVCDSALVETLIDRAFDAQSGKSGKSNRWKSWPKEPTEQAVFLWWKQWTKCLVEVFGTGEARSRVRYSGHVPLCKHIHSLDLGCFLSANTMNGSQWQCAPQAVCHLYRPQTVADVPR